MPALAYSYIRMSTEVQLKGDSLRRQLALSEEYAASKGLELVTEGYSDIGVSAFKGDNVRTGALGRFLEKVNDGTIPKGSYLLVESLDRLTRESIDTAITLFLSILRSGINIVTLLDRREYIAGSANFSDIIYSIVVMQRAHEESLTKSERISAVWGKKRNSAGIRRMTSNCPAWLAPSADGIGFDVIEERAAVVQKIFAYADSGVGSYAISRMLNEASIRTFGSENGWYTSYITKILTNRAVVGEFQPHRKAAGGRVADGPVAENYFPRIIDPELFERVQYARRLRKAGAAGRKGNTVSNLFSSIAFCGYCKSKMTYVDPGSRQGRPNLICTAARRRIGCERHPWRYADFEQSFLAFVREIDVQGLLLQEPNNGRRAKIVTLLSRLRERELKLKEEFEKLLELHLGMPGRSSLLREKIGEIETQRTSISDEISNLEIEERSLIASDMEYQAAAENIRNAIRDIASGTYELRAKVAQRIRAIVEIIYVYPAGLQPMHRRSIEFLKSITKPNGEVEPDETGPVIQQLERQIANEKSALKSFAVRFRNSPMRIVTVKPSNPLEFEQQLIADINLKTILGGEPIDQ